MILVCGVTNRPAWENVTVLGSPWSTDVWAVEAAVTSQHNRDQHQCFPAQCPLSQLCNGSRIPNIISRPSWVQVMLGGWSVLYVLTQRWFSSFSYCGPAAPVLASSNFILGNKPSNTCMVGKTDVNSVTEGLDYYRKMSSFAN